MNVLPRVKPTPTPVRRPILASLLLALCVPNIVLAVASLRHFARGLEAGDRFAYPDRGPLLQIGVCVILLASATIALRPRLQLPRRGWWIVALAAVIGLGAVPLAGSAVLERALLGYGCTECRAMGWLERGLWVAPGYRCE